jgi:hypothetical protein
MMTEIACFVRMLPSHSQMFIWLQYFLTNTCCTTYGGVALAQQAMATNEAEGFQRMPLTVTDLHHPSPDPINGKS